MNAVKTIYYYFYLALILFAGCKPADFTLSTPTTAPGTFNHNAFLTVSCVQCHESKRPVTNPIHGNGQDCLNCHTAQLNAQGVRTWLNLAHFDHNPMPTSCNQCHEGNRPNGVSGKPSIMPHLAGQWGATQDCASCHTYSQWKGKKPDGSDWVYFDHNRTLTSCKECHNSSTRDDRPTAANSTLVETTSPYHPQAYFDFNKTLLAGFNDGTIPTLSNGSTIGLTSDQAGLLNRINNKSFVANDQLDCLTCHQNQTNDRVWSLTNPSSTKSLFFKYDPTTLEVNQHLKVDPTTAATSEPTQCATCHEINRPITHINLDTSKSTIVTGMDTGDCKGCHTYTKTGGVPAPVVADWSNPRAFDHVVAQPVTCMDCHKNSIPLAQRATLLSKATHPVATGTYYAIDCAQCHTYDATLIPPNASAPARSWSNIAFDYRSHLKADGTTGPSSCIQCHKIDNNSLPDPSINPSHTAGARSSLDCKSCHVFNSTTKWYTFVAVFDHTKLDTVGSADRCDSCHKDSTMNLTTIKNPLANVPGLATRAVNPVVHIPIPTGLDCNACHKVQTTWLNNPAKTNVVYTHGTTDTCSSCHNLSNPKNIGMPAVVQKGTNHFPIGSMECSVCHTDANTSHYTTFTGTIFSHANINGNACSTCHNDPTFAGTVTKQLPLPQGTNHLVLPVGSDCSTCHISTTSFNTVGTNVTYSHNVAIDFDCNSCHVNHTGFAKGTSAASNPVHMTIPMMVVNGSTTTNPVQCSTCHKEVASNGTSLNIRTAPDFKIHTTANTQITTSANADTRCNVCHDGANATGKTSATYPSHPVFTGLQCVACHLNSVNSSPKYQSFAGGGFVHTLAVTNNNTTCNTCHSGASAIAKQSTDFAGHVPTGSSECVTCHTASLTSFTNFTNGNYPHNDGVACTTCHGNTAITSVTQKATSATGTVVHASTTAACNTCHADTATFTTWKIHTDATTTTNTTCNSCHTGLTNSYGKQTTAYSGHVNIGSAQCISCHSNTLTKTPKYLDFTGGVYTHTGSETCTNCHGNASMNVTQPTLSVIHTSNAAAACTTCHTNTVGFTTWRIHTDAATGNKTSCTTCHMTTQSPLVLNKISSSAGYNHFGITKTVGSAAAECATCHQSSMSTVTTTGPTGFIPTKFSGGLFHTNAVGSGIAPANNCTSCHTSSYSSLSATVMRMLPTTTGATPQHLTLPIVVATGYAAQCDTCHKDATFTAWKGMTLSTPTSTNVQYAHNINATTDANCSSCHTGATPGFAEGQSWYKNAAGTSIHMSTTAQCSTCHQGADAGGTLTIKYTDFVVHSDVSTQTDTRCNVCHDGAGAIGKTTAAFVPSVAVPTHPGLAGNQCVFCHKTSLGTTPKYATFAGGTNHTAASTNNWTSCNTCHLSAGGAIQNFNNSPGYVHFSTVNNVGANVECAVCHTNSIGANPPITGFASWSGGKFHLNVAASAITATTCANCHNNGLTNGSTIFRTLPAQHVTLKAPIGSSTNAECSTCHSVTNNSAPAIPNQWAGMAIAHSVNAAVPLNVTYTHSPGDAGNCVTCHTGATGFAEGITTVGLFTTNASVGVDTHLTLPQSNGVNVNCDTCHNVFTASGAVWKGMAVKNGAVGLNTPVTVSYNHLTMGTATCNSCHFDASANGLNTPHARAVGTNYAINSPYNASPVAHIGTAGSDCKACHQAAIAGGTTTTLPTNITMSAYQSFIGGIKQDHTSMTTNCLGCHWSGNGTTGTWQNANSTTASNSSFKHIDITSGSTVVQCSVCHVASMVSNGAGGFTGTSFAGGKFHAYQSNSGLSATTCATCHNSASLTYESTTGVFRKLPAGHLPLTASTGVTANAQCSTCHAVTNNSTSAVNSWNGTTFENKYNSAIPVNVTYTHAAGDTTCNTCHSTNVTTYKNNTGFATGYSNTTVHTSASVYPANNATLQCGTCHVSVAANGTTSVKTTPDFIVHSPSNTSSDTKCNACHLNGSSITKFNNYSNTGFSHFPTSGAECQTCHQASINVTAPAVKYSSFAGGLFHANTLISGVSTSTCSTCHKASGAAYGGVTAISSLTSHLTLPVSGTTTDCSTCHVSTNWHGTAYNNAGSVNVNYAHNINATTDAACSTCHDITKQVTGATPLNKGYATGKTASVTVHGTTAGTSHECSYCHTIVTGGGTTTAVKNTTDFKIHDTTNITASKNRCNVCHMTSGSATSTAITFNDASGAYTHFPTKTTSSTYAECSICHSNVLGGTSAPFVSTYSFAGGKFHSNVTATSIAATTCANCHNSASSLTYEKTAGVFRKLATTHLPIAATTGVTANAECSACHNVTHNSTTATNLWTGMALANAANSAVALNVTYHHNVGDTACTTCHKGTTGYSEGNLSAGNGHLTIPFTPSSTTVKAECAECHVVGTTGGATTLDSWKTWRAATPVVKYNAHNTTVVTNACSTCHTNAAGFAKGTAFDVNHPANTAAIGECSKCHAYTSQSIPSNTSTYTSFSSPAPQDHRAAADCLSCHYTASTSTFKNINANPTYKHFSILNTTLAPVQCSTCHAASLTSFTNFTGGVFHSTTATSNISTTGCTSCHNAGLTYGTTVFRGLPTVGTLHLNPSQPNLAVPGTTIGRGECSTCHTVDNSATPASANTWKGMLSVTPTAVTVTYTHNLTNDTNCIACHSAGGVTKAGYATGYTSNSFHSTTVTAQCSTCHLSGTSTGAAPVAKTTPDFKVHTLADTNNGTSCNACHLSGTNAIQNNAVRSPGYKHFAYNNGSTYAECSTCHSSTVASTTAYPVVNLTTGTFAGGLLHSKVPVSGISTTACSTCHNNAANVTNGTTAFKVMPAAGTGHLNPTIGTAATPATAITRGECSICHTVSNLASPATPNSWNGTLAEAASPVKVAYTHSATNDTNCNACHSLGATTKVGFATGYTSNSFHSATVTAQCSTCHLSGTSTGAAPVSKFTPDFKVHTLADTNNGTTCNACHLSAANSIQNNAVRSPGYKHFAYNNGTTYAECATCHSSTVASTTAYPVVNLTTGTFAGGLLHSKATASGINTTACSTCHNNAANVTNGTTVFRTLPAVGTAHLNPVQPNLATPAANITRGECSVCHTDTTFTNWKGMSSAGASPVKVAYTHSLTNDTNCIACHNTVLATFTAVPGYATAYTNNVVHTANTSTQCSTCHLDSTGTSAVIKTTPDFKVHTLANTNYGAKCNACHLSAIGSIQFNTVNSASYNHFPYANGSTYAECAICHQASNTITSKTVAPVVTITSSAGTTSSFKNGSFHPNATTAGTTVTAKCNTCHVSTNSTTATAFRAVPSTHLTLPTGSNCDTCHNINTTSGLVWKGMQLTVATASPYPVAYTGHPTSFSVRCDSCHANDSTVAKAGLADSMAQITPTNTHLPVPTGADCNVCHNITTSSGATWKGRNSDGANPVTVAFSHTGYTTTSCNTCHYDATTAGGATPRGRSTGTDYAIKSAYTGGGRTAYAPHMATNGSECGGCHQASMTAPNNYTSFQPGIGTDHRAAATCTNCHWSTITSSIVNYSASPGYNHFPITTSGGTVVQCSVCHQASMVLDASNNFPTPAGGFAGGVLHSVATTSGLTVTTCGNCHNNTTYTHEKTAGVFKVFPTGAHLNLTQPTVAAPGTQTTSRGECSVCHIVDNNAPTITNTWKTWSVSPADTLITAVTVASPGVFSTATAHNLRIGDAITFNNTGTTQTSPTGITVGNNHSQSTSYYVVSVPSATTFTISATNGGAAIAITAAGTAAATTGSTLYANLHRVMYFAHSANDTDCNACHTGASGYSRGQASYKATGGQALHMPAGISTAYPTGTQCSTCHKPVTGTTYTDFEYGQYIHDKTGNFGTTILPRIGSTGTYHKEQNGTYTTKCILCHDSSKTFPAARIPTNYYPYTGNFYYRQLTTQPTTSTTYTSGNGTGSTVGDAHNGVYCASCHSAKISDGGTSHQGYDSQHSGNNPSKDSITAASAALSAASTAVTFTANSSTIATTSAVTTGFDPNITNRVIFSTTGTMPTGLTAGTVYYIKTAVSTTSFTVAATYAGTAITPTTAGTGTITYTAYTPQIRAYSNITSRADCSVCHYNYTDWSQHTGSTGTYGK